MKQSSLAYVFMKPMFQALTELRNTTDNWTLARDFCSIEVFALASDEELMGLILGGGKAISLHTNQPKFFINGTERSPKGRFSCRGVLDFDEDCMFDVVSHLFRLLMGTSVVT